MHFYENKELYLKMIKAVFNHIKANVPKKYDNLLTDEYAEKMVNDESLVNRYLKAKSTYENYNESRAECSQLQVDSKVTVNHGISRATMDTYVKYKNNDEKKERVEYLKKLSTTKGATEQATKYFDQLLNYNFLEQSLTDTNLLIDKYAQNPGFYNMGFVTLQMIDEIKGAKPNSDFSQIIKENKVIFETGGIFKSACATSANPYSLLIPDFVDSQDLPNLVSSMKDVIIPFLEENDIEDIKIDKGKTFDTAFNDFIMNYLSYEKDSKKSEKFRLELQAKGINNSKDLIIKYHYLDKEGNKVEYGDFAYQVQEGTKKIDDFQIVENSEEEQKRIEELFNNIYVFDLSIDKNAYVELTKAFYKNLAEAFPNKASEFSEEKAIALANDNETIELHNKALEYSKALDEQKYLAKTLPLDNRFSVNNVAKKYGFLFMEGTRNNLNLKEQNIATLKKLSTSAGATELINKELEKLTKIDFQAMLKTDPKDCIANFEEYNKIRKALYLKDLVFENEFEVSSKYKDFIEKNKEMFDMLKSYENAVKHYANDLTLYAPESTANMSQEDFEKYNEVLQNTLMENKSKSADYYKYEKDDIKKMVDDFTNSKAEFIENNKLSNVILNEINNGNISKNFVADSYIVDEKQKHINTVEYFKNIQDGSPNEVSVNNFDDESKNFINELNDNPLKSLSTELLSTMVFHKDDILAEIDKIENARAKISFFNSPSYNRMTESFNRLREFFNNDKVASLVSIENLNNKNAKELSRNLLEVLNDVNDAARGYIDAKSGSRMNATRQTRFDAANNLVDLLSMDYINEKYSSLNGDEKVIGNEPLIKYGSAIPISVEEAQMLDNLPETDDLDKSFEVEKNQVVEKEEENLEP